MTKSEQCTVHFWAIDYTKNLNLNNLILRTFLFMVKIVWMTFTVVEINKKGRLLLDVLETGNFEL